MTLGNELLHLLQFFRLYIEVSRYTDLEACHQKHLQAVDQFRQGSTSRIGRNVDRLDYSKNSLEPAWQWFLKDSKLSRKTLGLEMFDEELPYWAVFHAPLLLPLGAKTCWNIHGLMAYFMEVIFRNFHGSKWVLGKSPGEDGHNQPLVKVLNGEFGPMSILFLAHSALLPGEAQYVPSRTTGLIDLYNMRFESSAKPSNPEPDFEVSEGMDSMLLVTFSDELAYADSVLDDLTSHMKASYDLQNATRSDREVISISSDEIEKRDLEETIVRFLEGKR